jgi:hypothetical protein
MNEKLVEIELTADVINGDLVAHMCFVNNTNKVVYLDDQTICYENRIRGDYFKIKNEKGKEVDYTGQKGCRDLKPELFLKLNLKGKIETYINLSEVYELKKGKKYTIQYAAYHPSYLEEQELAKIESNIVEVVYK